MKDDSGTYAVFTDVCVTNDCRKSNGMLLQDYLIGMDKHLTPYQHTLCGKDGGCSKIAQNSKVRMS